MKHSFVPKLCQGENPKFSGQIVINLPSADERFEYMSEANVDFGKLDSTTGPDYMRLTALLMKKVYNHIEKVDLVKKSDGSKITSIDSLKYDGECFPILSELANAMLSGFVLGKN